MSKYKYMITICTIVIILIIIPLLPLTISRMQDTKLINHLQVETIAVKQETDIQNSSLSIAEKLDLLIGYTKKDKNIILTTTSQSINNENVEKLRAIIHEELQKLHTLEILTSLDFNDAFICDTFALKKYSNAIDPTKYVSVYQISFTNELQYLEVIIDISTNKIFQYNYINKTYFVENYGEVTIFAKEYLGLNNNELEKYRNSFQIGYKTVIKEK